MPGSYKANDHWLTVSHTTVYTARFTSLASHAGGAIRGAEVEPASEPPRIDSGILAARTAIGPIVTPTHALTQEMS